MNEFKRIEVWPGKIRLLHWLMALSTSVLLVSGWIMGSELLDRGHPLHAAVLELHRPAGQLLMLLLIWRGFHLLEDRGVAGIGALIPKRSQVEAIGEFAKFYITFGKRQLPSYYGHTPFWGPLYLVMFILLAIAVVTGMLMDLDSLRRGMGLIDEDLLGWHVWTLLPLTVLVVAHVLTTLLHDWKGEGGDISAMVNGYRLFSLDQKTDTSQSIKIGQWQPPKRPPSQ